MTLYCVTGTVYSSLSMYYEGRRAPLQLAEGERRDDSVRSCLFSQRIAVATSSGWSAATTSKGGLKCREVDILLLPRSRNSWRATCERFFADSDCPARSNKQSVRNRRLMLNVCVAGATGWAGRSLVPSILNTATFDSPALYHDGAPDGRCRKC